MVSSDLKVEQIQLNLRITGGEGGLCPQPECTSPDMIAMPFFAYFAASSSNAEVCSDFICFNCIHELFLFLFVFVLAKCAVYEFYSLKSLIYLKRHYD